MSASRRPLTMLAGVAVAASFLIVPAQAAVEPTTLAIEGTVRVVVVDTFTRGAHADRRYTVVTDDGAKIPVDLDETAPANGRFRGEVVVTGDVASTLRSKGLLPGAGSTIGEDTRAGRAAVAVAEDQATPLTVASSTIVPASSAAPTPSEHRAYVAKMTDQGSVDDTDAQIEANLDAVLDYWETESDGYITDFSITGPIEEFDSTSDIGPSEGCGITSPDDIWDQVEDEVFPSVDFNLPGNHLIVLVGEECIAGGSTAGMATVGESIASGGVSIIGYGTEIFTSTAVHEIGHNFGLTHANLDGCAPDELEWCEYLDLYSPMGFSVQGSDFEPPALGSLYRRQLGLTAPGEIAALDLAPGQTALTQAVALAPRPAASGRRGLLVKDPKTGITYSIDWRSGTLRDAGAFYGSDYAFSAPDPLYPAGIVVERQVAGGDIHLMSRSVSGRPVGAFGVGTTFAPSSGLSVAVTSIGATANVTVRLGAPKPPVVLKKLSTKTPKISGTARVGKTLKVKVGSWSPRPSYRYQWYANGKKITKKGARSSFKLTSKQKGKRITVRVTGSKSGYVTVAKTSKPTKKVKKK